MIGISLCMIVRDEEETLPRCLESVRGAFDETVIVDTGSSDGTKDVAQKFRCKVYDFPWQDDFAAARNFSFSKAEGDYLIWLDADDVVPEESLARLPALRERLERETPDAVFCPYDIGGESPLLTFERERFLRASAGLLWQGRVHECIAVGANRLRDGFRVVHLGSAKPRGMRNLNIYRKWAGEEPLSPRDLFYYGRELCSHKLYTEAAAVLTEAIGGGWYVYRIEACKALAECFAARGDREGAKTALLRSFCFAEPRASVCCRIGRLFREEGRFREAAFWYETARTCRDHSAEGDFEDPSARTLTPLLELVCCYYRTGERERAKECHQKTEELAPAHPSVVYNRQFFR